MTAVKIGRYLGQQNFHEVREVYILYQAKSQLILDIFLVSLSLFSCSLVKKFKKFEHLIKLRNAEFYVMLFIRQISGKINHLLSI